MSPMLRFVLGDIYTTVKYMLLKNALQYKYINNVIQSQTVRNSESAVHTIRTVLRSCVTVCDEYYNYLITKLFTSKCKVNSF